MKTIVIFFLTITCCLSAMSQTISISGTVKDSQGQSVPLAFVRDMRHYYATYADSTGTFNLRADPASTITVIAPGYSDASVKIEGKTSFNVVMTKGTSSSASTAVSIDVNGSLASLSSYINKQTIVSQSGSSTAVRAGFTQEPTKGSPYLYTIWARGFAITNGDSLLFDVNNLYNYDKTTGGLVFTKDGKNILQANTQGIKSFNLFNGKSHPAVFVNAPDVSKLPFIEVLVATPKYRIYKQVDTKLVRADFHSDGVIQSGNRYDEYNDYVHYFFVKQGEKPKQISLRKKTIKELLAGDADKFMSTQGDRDVDDDYLRDLNYAIAP